MSSSSEDTLQLIKIASEKFNARYDQVVNELVEFLKIRSISNNKEYQPEIKNGAQWLAKKLESMGIDRVSIVATDLHPIVFAAHQTDPQLPAVLIYGHYDVQPPGEANLWQSAPFEPHIEDSLLYARGAADMKGPIMAALAAVDSIFSAGSLPVNLLFLFEGEEEIGSPSIRSFLETHREKLAANTVLNIDAGIIAEDVPTITYALRGLAYFELLVKGPKSDLHSGIFGGIVDNPAQVLSQVIGSMKDRNGRITLPGYYDSVRPLAEFDRAQMAKLPLTEAAFLAQSGAPALFGESGYSRMEQNTARPTFEINGLLSGYTGEGTKTIIPAWALAKFSMRLVPDQTPEVVEKQLVEYLNANMPNTVTWELKTYTGGLPAYVDPNTPAIHAMKEAMRLVWQADPVFKQEGGSIPIVNEIQEVLGMESVLTGFACPDDNLHAPNEKLNLRIFHKGVHMIIAFLYLFAATMKEKEAGKNGRE